MTLSSEEAEFWRIAKGAMEIRWLKKLMHEIEFPSRLPTQLMCDNKVAVNISENMVYHDRTKHVEVARHFIKESLKECIIELPFVKKNFHL